MQEGLLIAGALLLLAVLGLIVLLLRRGGSGDSVALDARLENLTKGQERAEKLVREEIAQNRKEAGDQASRLRDEVQQSVKHATDSMVKSMGEIATAQRGQLGAFADQLAKLTQANEQKLEALRSTVAHSLQQIQEDNGRKLDQMRQTVDEKLQGTLEKRLGESFKLVSERLELVQRGLGEMRELANGVGDLKRVLTNVKTRGTWGEIQLGALLEQILTPDQYGTNVATKPGSAERVEFAIKLPGRDEMEGQVVWLPVDAKFPKEDYERLMDAQDKADPVLADESSRRLEDQLKRFGRDIRDKYLSPPHTTDFAVLFLPVEGLYAEVIRRIGLADTLQREYRVVVAGPTTLAALLNALQMGFRTLAIQRRSSEVWTLLGAVKTEFGKFSGVLENVKKRLDQASESIEDASRKSRTIERKLRQVQELPAGEAQVLLGQDETLAAPGEES
jgi:DNA recombination protein RmuC